MARPAEHEYFLDHVPNILHSIVRHPDLENKVVPAPDRLLFPRWANGRIHSQAAGLLPAEGRTQPTPPLAPGRRKLIRILQIYLFISFGGSGD